MTRWEYREVFVNHQYGWWMDQHGQLGKLAAVRTPARGEYRFATPLLEELGAEGWELAGVVGEADREQRLYFKRPRPDAPPE